jgi:hypothetical protein
MKPKRRTPPGLGRVGKLTVIRNPRATPAMLREIAAWERERAEELRREVRALVAVRHWFYVREQVSRRALGEARANVRRAVRRIAK